MKGDLFFRGTRIGKATVTANGVTTPAEVWESDTNGDDWTLVPAGSTPTKRYIRTVPCYNQPTPPALRSDEP
jgi:hypothetical protein